MRCVVGIDLDVVAKHGGGAWLVERAAAFANVPGGSVDLVWVGDDASRVSELEALAEAALPEAVRGRCWVQPGKVIDVLAEISRTADALVIGPREPDGFARFVENPMATRVLKVSRCPVYVPRSNSFGTRPPRLLVGVDVHGEHGRKVLGWAAGWAQRFGGTVDAIYTLPGSLPPIRRPALRAAAERAWAQQHQHQQDALTDMMSSLPRDVQGEAIVVPGEAEDVLVRLSATHDLVLVGSRERQGMLSRWLVGHVADHVVRRSAADVLVLPTAFVHETTGD